MKSLAMTEIYLDEPS